MNEMKHYYKDLFKREVELAALKRNVPLQLTSSWDEVSVARFLKLFWASSAAVFSVVSVASAAGSSSSSE